MSREPRDNRPGPLPATATIVTTPLQGPLKREITIDGEPYTLTITPEGMNLALKGRRKGFEMHWRDLVSGEAALATALNASLTARLGRAAPSEQATPAKRSRGSRRG
jgi:hypothetical protein